MINNNKMKSVEINKNNDIKVNHDSLVVDNYYNQIDTDMKNKQTEKD